MTEKPNAWLHSLLCGLNASKPQQDASDRKTSFRISLSFASLDFWQDHSCSSSSCNVFFLQSSFYPTFLFKAIKTNNKRRDFSHCFLINVNSHYTQMQKLEHFATGGVIHFHSIHINRFLFFNSLRIAKKPQPQSVYIIMNQIFKEGTYLYICVLEMNKLPPEFF